MQTGLETCKVVELFMQSFSWLCVQLGPPKVSKVSNLVLSLAFAPDSPFHSSGSPAQPCGISCSHQDLHPTPRLSPHTKTFIPCLHQDVHLSFTPKPSSLLHTKSFISCLHQGLDASSQARLIPIPTTVSMGSHPPASPSWAVIICLPLGCFLFPPFEMAFLLPFESAWRSCALLAKT